MVSNSVSLSNATVTIDGETLASIGGVLNYTVQADVANAVFADFAELEARVICWPESITVPLTVDRAARWELRRLLPPNQTQRKTAQWLRERQPYGPSKTRAIRG